MDELLAKERAAHEYVKSLQSHEDTPFKDTLAAFDTYRTVVQDAVFANFTDAERLETRLWAQHTETRQLLARTLKSLRQAKEQRTVEIRIAVEMYLRFLKQSIRFYRGYIYQLSTRFDLPDLQAVARHVKSDSLEEMSIRQDVDKVMQRIVLYSCHRTLIYLGDLCRYRASDQLDSKQDFGTAVGYYALACTIRPDSGWGYHQQAVVALEQKNHLRGVYYLYRSFLVDHPVVMAKKNLNIQYEKANAAWDSGDLIVKTPGHDLEESALIGWFVRLHSMCVKGDTFRGYDELLRELLGRLKREIVRPTFDIKLRRMILVNISAQHTAMDNYTDMQTPANEQAFYYSLHINILFFTTLMDLLYQDLVPIAKSVALVDAELTAKITPALARLLPAIRLYSQWLLLNSHLLVGLVTTEFLESAINDFWRAYAQVLDIISAVFPIWDLEDAAEVIYLLEEDVEVLGFSPLDIKELSGLTRKLLRQANDAYKPKYNDSTVNRLSPIEEHLARVLHLLESGSFIANNIDDTPIFIKGTRFVRGADTLPSALPRPPTPPPVMKPKPLSYAAAASANARLKKLQSVKTDIPMSSSSNGTPDTPNAVQATHLQRMVDNLVDDKDTAHPMTPPSNKLDAIQVDDSGEVAQYDTPSAKEYQMISPSTTIVPATANAVKRTPRHPKEDLSDFSPRPKIAGDRVASLWSPTNTTLPSRVNSPSQFQIKHRRGHSSTSVRSINSPRLGDSWSSVDSATRPKHQAKASLNNGIAASAALQTLSTVSPERGNMLPNHIPITKPISPLLFGGTIWSPASRQPDLGD